jgi:hypothetical protein
MNAKPLEAWRSFTTAARLFCGSFMSCLETRGIIGSDPTKETRKTQHEAQAVAVTRSVFAASIGSRFVALSPTSSPRIEIKDRERWKMMNGSVESRRSSPSRLSFVSFGCGTFLSALQLILLPRNGLGERRINFVCLHFQFSLAEALLTCLFTFQKTIN